MQRDRTRRGPASARYALALVACAWWSSATAQDVRKPQDTPKSSGGKTLTTDTGKPVAE